jgi:TolB-like protein
VYKRQLTLADYGFTPDDIKDVERRRQLALILRNTTHANGEFYRVFRSFVDPDEIAAMTWQEAEKRINYVFEGNYKFA